MPNQVVNWIEKNPWMAGGIIVGGGLVILWYMGFFTKAQSSSDGGTTNMAAAYYAAEAAQGVAGTQLAMQQSSDTAQTAQVGLQATAAASIAQIQATRDATLANYGADVAKTVAGYDADVAKTQASYNLTAQQYADQTIQTAAGYANDTAKTLAYYGYATSTHNADMATYGQEAHDLYALQSTQDTNKANVFTAFLNNVLPAELQRTGGNIATSLPGIGTIAFGSGSLTPDPNAMRAAGFSEAQIRATWGGG
jgi:hypothetical protein